MRRILYIDEEIKISYFVDSKKEHFLKIGDQSAILKKGVLEELSRTFTEDLSHKLEVINHKFNEALLENNNISYSEVGFAIAKARIKELEYKLLEAYPDKLTKDF